VLDGEDVRIQGGELTAALNGQIEKADRLADHRLDLRAEGGRVTLGEVGRSQVATLLVESRPSARRFVA
jgi:hypothetical protein